MSLLLAYYGDDFTGSTDALEGLELAGVSTLLAADLTGAGVADAAASARGAPFACGLAGLARAMPPAEMDAALPTIFAAFASIAPHFVHYKICSTFDSSPTRGSIGRAIELARRTFPNRVTPLLVAAPRLGRYCAFGNLFARAGADGPIVRLDRHSTMCRHPQTPMDEADLRRHLARQTDLPIELIDLPTLDAGEEAAWQAIERIADGSIVLLDGVTPDHLAVVGALLLRLREREPKPQLVVGSSGVQEALSSAWRLRGLLPEPAALARRDSLRPLPPVDRIVVFSGSCSPTTAAQIAAAVEAGFVSVPLEAPPADADPRGEELTRQVLAIAKRVAAEHDAGRSVIVEASRGVEDARYRPADGERVGAALAEIARGVVASTRVLRLVVAGGDTSGRIARRLGVRTLRMVGRFVPGAPLCRAGSDDPHIDGVEIVFKGGQVGDERLFVAARDGVVARDGRKVDR